MNFEIDSLSNEEAFLKNDNQNFMHMGLIYLFQDCHIKSKVFLKFLLVFLIYSLFLKNLML